MDGGLRILKSAIQVADPFELHRPNRRHPLSSLSPPPDRWRCSHHLSARKSCLVGRRSGILRLASSSSFCRLECNEDPERERERNESISCNGFWGDLKMVLRWIENRILMVKISEESEESLGVDGLNELLSIFEPLQDQTAPFRARALEFNAKRWKTELLLQSTYHWQHHGGDREARGQKPGVVVLIPHSWSSRRFDSISKVPKIAQFRFRRVSTWFNLKIEIINKINVQRTCASLYV